MPELLAVLIALAGGTYRLWSTIRKRAELRASWTATATECGLKPTDEAVGRSGVDSQ